MNRRGFFGALVGAFVAVTGWHGAQADTSVEDKYWEAQRFIDELHDNV